MATTNPKEGKIAKKRQIKLGKLKLTKETVKEVGKAEAEQIKGGPSGWCHPTSI